METLPVVGVVDEFPDGRFCLLDIFISVQVHLFHFERAVETFCKWVVDGDSRIGHANFRTDTFKSFYMIVGTILSSAIGVMECRSADGERHVQRFQHQFFFHMERNRPANHFSCEHIQDDGHIAKLAGKLHIRNVANPQVVWVQWHDVFDDVGEDAETVSAVGRFGLVFPSFLLESGCVHDAHYFLVIDDLPNLFECLCNLAVSITRGY